MVSQFISVLIVLYKNYFFIIISPGFYPVGGASEIAFQMIPAIESAGGAVVSKAHATKILTDACGKVQGVEVNGKTVIRLGESVKNSLSF